MTGTQASVGATSTLDRMIGLLTAHAAAVDHTEVGAVLDGIHDARRVFVTGAGRSGLVARAFANRLMHLGMSVHVVGEVTTPAIERGDALLVVSNSGSGGAVVHAARTAAAVGARVLAVSGVEAGPVREVADRSVVLPLAVPAPASRREDALDPPMGTVFEQLAFLVLEAAVLDLQKRLRVTEGEMRARHANLE